MRIQFVFLTLTILVCLGSTVTTVTAQTDEEPGDAAIQNSGHPVDLTGLWARLSDRSLFRQFEAAPPMTPWAAQRFQLVQESADPDQRDPIITACAPPGMPRILQQGRPFEIFQVPHRVLLVFEVDSKVRHVWMDGRDHPKNLDLTWMGHSIGHWEGDTLVVETVGLNEHSWLDSNGYPHSEDLRVIERFRRTGPEALEVQVLYRDPKAYTKPWRGILKFQLKPDWELMEWVTCDDRIHQRLGRDPCEDPSWELEVLCAQGRDIQKDNER